MRCLVASVIVLLGVSSSHAQSTNRYSILFHHKMSGHLTTQISGDGSLTVDFTYRDNGRGPDLKEEFALADDGTMRRYAGKGKARRIPAMRPSPIICRSVGNARCA